MVQSDMVVESDDMLESAVADIVLFLQSKNKTKTTSNATAVESKNVETDQKAIQKALWITHYTSSCSMTRPQCQNTIDTVFTEFVELIGAGRVGGDSCIRGGLGVMGDLCCVVIASFKGHTPGDMQAANYGMSSPGYKALRLIKMAERFNVPIVTLVDTCGALPSFSAERDGQSEAIATDLTTMASLKVPIVTVIAGEGK